MATLKLVGKMYYSDLRINGKRVQRSLSTDKRAAQRILDDMVMVRRADRRGEQPKDMRFDFFRERHKGIIKSPKTMYRDELAFRMLKSSIPVTHLAQITPEFVIRLIAKWQSEGKTVSTIARAVHAIKAAMRVAEGWRYVTAQPWHMVKVKEPKGRLHWWSVDEVNRLLAVCEGEWKTYAMLMLYAGLRPSEAYFLEWSDLNFVRHSLWVHAKPGWTPKGGKERYVPLAKNLEDFLQALPTRDGYVVGPERMTTGTLDVFFRRLVRRAKLKGSAYTLRHTFASHLASHGVSLPKIGELMGHSDPKTTAIYAHLAPEAMNQAITKLPNFGTSTSNPVSTSDGRLSVI